MKNQENQIKPKEAQDALNSIKEMEQAGLKRVLPAPGWLVGTLALLIGTQISLLGAGIRTYNTIIIILIIMLAITAINKNRSAGVMERIVLPKRTLIISVISLILTYFLTIIAGQYLKATFGYNWAPFAIGLLVIIGIWGLAISAQRNFVGKHNAEKS